MGREPQTVTKTFLKYDGTPFTQTVELFPWEKTDRVGEVRRALGWS
jgi:hypothetical protein